METRNGVTLHVERIVPGLWRGLVLRNGKWEEVEDADSRRQALSERDRMDAARPSRAVDRPVFVVCSAGAHGTPRPQETLVAGVSRCPGCGAPYDLVRSCDCIGPCALQRINCAVNLRDFIRGLPWLIRLRIWLARRRIRREMR